MILSAVAGSWTPASSITIWSLPCFRISGSETPSLSIRFRMIVTERSMSDEVSLWFSGGTALRTTSRPPCRSRPSVTFLWAGEPGIASAATPASASAIRPTRIRCERRFVTRGGAERLAVVGGDRLLGYGLVLELFLGRGARGDGPAVEAHGRSGRDLDVEHVVLDRLHRRVKATGGDDLVAGSQAVLHCELGLRALSLRPDEQQPHQEEQADEEDDEAGQIGTSETVSSL